MKKLLIALALVAVLLVVYVFAHAGLFAKVSFAEGKFPATHFACTAFVGPYSKVGVPMKQFYDQIAALPGVGETRMFGIYLDDPKTVKPEACRTLIGCTLPLGFALPAGIKGGVLDERPALVSELPYRNMLSIFLGVMKYYKALPVYQKEHHLPGGPVVEFYDLKDGVIRYYVLDGAQARIEAFLK